MEAAPDPPKFTRIPIKPTPFIPNPANRFTREAQVDLTKRLLDELFND